MNVRNLNTHCSKNLSSQKPWSIPISNLLSVCHTVQVNTWINEFILLYSLWRRVQWKTGANVMDKFNDSIINLTLWRWELEVPRKIWHISTKLHGVTTPKTAFSPPRALYRFPRKPLNSSHIIYRINLTLNNFSNWYNIVKQLYQLNRANVQAELMSWSCVFEKLTAQHVVNSYVCCANLRFITVFTTAHHFSLFLARLISSRISHPVSLVSTLILSSYLCSGLPSYLFSSGFPNKTLNVNIVHNVHCLVINLYQEP